MAGKVKRSMAQPWINGTEREDTARLRQLMGPAISLLHPGYSLLFLIPAFAALLPITSQPSAIALAALSTYFLLMAARIEKPWLSATPLPPLTVLCLGGWLRCGLGGTLIALSRPGPSAGLEAVMLRHLPETQLLWLTLCGSALVVFACFPAQSEPQAPSSPQAAGNQPLVNIALICGTVALGLILIGSVSGTLDRSPAPYLHWVVKRWRPDSVLVMFARFRDIFFLLAPLGIVKARHNWQKLMLILSFAMYVTLALPMGGRGLLLWPLIYGCLGLWLTPLSPKRLRAILLAVAATCLILLPVIQSYKVGLASFSNHRANLQERIETALAITSFDGITLQTSPEILGSTGRALYGCVDALLFQPQSSTRPRAGWHRLDSLLTAWIPDLILPKTRPVRDGHLIAAEAGGATREQAESRVYTSHDCISLGGDLYWRGGWPIVVLGSALAAMAYRLVSNLWYRYAGWGSTWQILLLLYPATFLTMYPAGSIGETAWLWMWDLPKYVFMIGIICFITGKLPRKTASTS